MNCNLVLQLMRDNRRKANISNSNNDTNYIDDFWANLKPNLNIYPNFESMYEKSCNKISEYSEILFNKQTKTKFDQYNQFDQYN
jgi:hypothetical protein